MLGVSLPLVCNRILVVCFLTPAPLLLTGVRHHPPGRTDKLSCRCFGAPACRVFPDHLITCWPFGCSVGHYHPAGFDALRLAKIVAAPPTRSPGNQKATLVVTHVRMERERSSETMQPGSKVAKLECSESSSGGSSPTNSPPAGERCHLAPGLLQEARCSAPSSKPGLRSCGVCSKPVGCSHSSIYMAFDRPFCSTSCREQAVLEHFARSLPTFDLPPSSNQHFSAALAG